MTAPPPSQRSPSDRPRRRSELAAALPLVVAAGLVVRFGLPGVAGDLAGGALYTALVYILVALARPAARTPQIAAAAFAISALIELFQLTPVPAAIGDAFAPARLVLGSAFAATDFVGYAAGACAAASVDLALNNRTKPGTA